MTKLHDTVCAYYLSHRKALSKDKQFHLCTRLGAWRGEAAALDRLKQLRSWYIPAGADELAASLRAFLNRPLSANINALDLRRPYFANFPQLRGINLALFKVRHLEAVYGIDVRETLKHVISEHELEALRERLLADEAALRILSTYAINFLYLKERIFQKNDRPDAIPLDYLYRVGDGYDLYDPTHVQLLIYLYTHCIIGDSNFYTQHVPAALLTDYRRILSRLEDVIEHHFAHINLDNKLEFLVCARICQYRSPLFARIQTECESSLSPKGDFLVDTHNSFKQSNKITFESSEHRNVLFIMSGSTYTPHSIRV